MKGFARIIGLFCLVGLASGVFAVPAFAASPTGVPHCEGMAAEVGRRAGLPQGYLPAISRIESGRQVKNERMAWPWTLNHSGKGLYFESRAEALAYLKEATKKGRTNIDVGCMQINHYWHGHQFASLEEMIEPARNIEYAASYLKELYDRHGSWVEAIKHYHSPDEARGARYFRGFEAAHRRVKDTAPTAVASTVYENFFDFAVQKPSASLRTGTDAAFVQGMQGGRPLGADEVYDRLLAALGPDAAVTGFTLWQSEPHLAKRTQTRGVVRQKWSAVESFRSELARDP